ncbi:MAG TPA: DNA polymerase ligase N-terminal domain-containing protein [Flavitalea sp.]|nr:DNA polymerase ligase N-terminal domain-containing protein [Flavitalea sp.]
MALTKYNEKRNFEATSEPKGKEDKTSKSRFVIQRHHASRLHYDFRLELGGVLKSWAVPKGPSKNTTDKRLAMMVEDHPVSYIDFEGFIPEGNYGAGHVMVWDKGTFQPVNADHEKITEKEALEWLENKGELKFELKGKKMKGEFVLVRLKKAADNSWLLIKHRDRYSTTEPYNSEDEVPVSVKKKGEKKKN